MGDFSFDCVIHWYESHQSIINLTSSRNNVGDKLQVLVFQWLLDKSPLKVTLKGTDY